jgi:hypothetical protein
MRRGSGVAVAEAFANISTAFFKKAILFLALRDVRVYNHFSDRIKTVHFPNPSFFRKRSPHKYH